MVKKIPKYVQNRLSREHLAGSLRLLQLLEAKGTVTQTNAAQTLGLSIGSCNLHFQKLEHLGLIRRADVLSREGRGRSTIVWELDYKKNGVLLILFEAPFVEVVLTDFSGAIRFRNRKNVSQVKTGKTLLTQLEKLICNTVEKARKIECVIRRGLVVAPGILDPRTSAVVQSVHFPAMNGVDFAAWVKERFALPCNCASLGAAFYHGEASRFPPDIRVMVINWDMGIGMVAGIKGRIISSPADLFLSKLGHLRVRANGRACYCGGSGCLEAYVGGRAILDMLNDSSIQTLDALIAAINTGHAPALKLVRAAARQLGESLTWPLQVTGAEKLLVSGSLGKLFPYIQDSLESGLSLLFTADEIRNIEPAATENSQEALCRGAFQMAYRGFFYP